MNDSSSPVMLVPNKPDMDRAKELRSKIETALEPVCRAMDEAMEAGFLINFNLAPDYRRRHVISVLKIMKEFS